jgi:hypothetical protein
MLSRVVAAIFLLVFVTGPTFAEMRIADPIGSGHMSDESMKNWMREELGSQLEARDNKIEALQTQVAVRDKRIEALLRQPDIEQLLGDPHLTLTRRQTQATVDNLVELDSVKICGMDSDDNDW